MRKSQNIEDVIDQIIETLGDEIVVGTPLAAGKPNFLLNALYKRVKDSPSIKLTICTALTLERPKGKSELERRFIKLFENRVFEDYPDLEYELDRTRGKLPSHIKVVEFYFPPGKYLNDSLSQQNYISSNYTHVARDMVDRGVNLILQMVAERGGDYSLSCNADVTSDMIPLMRAKGDPSLVIGQVNQNLPFMYGDAVVDQSIFDVIVDKPSQYYKIFGPPKMSISDADYMIGLYASALVKDDGELQVGIGSLGDAVIYGILLKHQNNELYQKLLEQLDFKQKHENLIQRIGDLEPFEKGLFGATEMMVDGFIELFKNGILKKQVFDNIPLQRLINQKLINPLQLKLSDIEHLVGKGIVTFPLSEKDFQFLKYWGFLKEGIEYSQPFNKVRQDQMGTSLKNGHIVHAGFFLGPTSFYQFLRDLPEEERKLFAMKSVRKVNHLYGHEELDRLHRKNARFINTCMMTTLAGAHVSDGLADGRVVSGVGGQFNFVSMAQELPDGHSILTMRSTRTKKGKTFSNIVFNSGHITIPRHMRDILVTEYGIAFLRGKTDEEIIIELLKVCDSRFQQDLINKAKSVGKLSRNFVLPKEFSENFPIKYVKLIKQYKNDGFFQAFPFGTDLTNDEIALGGALKRVKAKMDSGLFSITTLLFKALKSQPSSSQLKLLSLLELSQPKTFVDKIYQKIISTELSQ